MEQSRKRATDVVGIVQNIRREMPRIGTRKLYYMLYPVFREQKVGRDRLFDILRANRMLIKPVRSYHITTNSHHRFHKYKNLIADMELTRPEEVWVSDITYIGTRNRHMYLSLVTDAYSKKVMGYNLSGSLDTIGCLNALKMANRNRIYKQEPLIHHSDRGIQYCSDAYQKMLDRYHIIPSMTESYDPYANAIAERINGILKQEFLLENMNLPLSEMKRVIQQAVYKYNNLRPHYSCQYNTPESMHHQRDIKIKCYKRNQLSKTSLAELT